MRANLCLEAVDDIELSLEVLFAFARLQDSVFQGSDAEKQFTVFEIVRIREWQRAKGNGTPKIIQLIAARSIASAVVHTEIVGNDRRERPCGTRRGRLSGDAFGVDNTQGICPSLGEA